MIKNINFKKTSDQENQDVTTPSKTINCNLISFKSDNLAKNCEKASDQRLQEHLSRLGTNKQPCVKVILQTTNNRLMPSKIKQI